MAKKQEIDARHYDVIIAPHITEEIWRGRGHEVSVHASSWPAFDADAAAADVITLIVQVNGKVRDKIEVPADVSQEAAEAAALSSDKVQGWLEGATVRKVIVVPGRLVNIVAG